jgi:hypothetical protein
VQPPARRRRQAEEHADPGGHGRRGQPVAPRDPPRAGHGQVAEDEQQLGRQDGLDQGQVAEVQRGELEAEPAHHGRDAEQPDRPAGQAEDEPDIEAGRLVTPGALALAHRGRGRTQGRRDGQQDRLLHQPAPFSAGLRRRRPRLLIHAPTTARRSDSITDVLTAICATICLSLPAATAHTNGGVRRFPGGVNPRIASVMCLATHQGPTGCPRSGAVPLAGGGGPRPVRRL